MKRQNFLTLSLFHIVLFAAGMALVLHYGPIGFYPWNQSIVFDGGWRILCGQVPFRDFTAPNAIVPSIMQAGFFAVFGVSWRSYILHAAVMNGLFSIMVFWFLRAFDLGIGSCFFYGLLSGIFFYPPAGVPYIDDHAFFFSILALCCLFWSERSSTYSSLLLIFVPVFFLFGYLSKQLPTVLFIGFAIIYLHFRRPEKKRVIVFSFFAIVVLTALLFWLWGSEWNLMQYYFFELPQSLGMERLRHALLRNKALDFFSIFRSPLLIGVTGFAVAFVGAIAIWSKRNGRKIPYSKMGVCLSAILISVASWYIWKVFTIAAIEAILIDALYFRNEKNLHRRSIWIAQSLIIIGVAFVGLSNMVPSLALPWLMIAVGLTQATLRNNSKIQKWSIALAAVAVLDACIFNIRVNEPRAALFISAEQLAAPQTPALAGPIEAMKGPVYGDYPFTARALSELVQYLHRMPGNFWYFGDASVVYGASEKPSVDPALWFHAGLSIPPMGSNAFEKYEDRILASFRKNNVRAILLEDTATKSGCSFEGFEIVRNFIALNALDTIDVAGFTVIRLRQAFAESGELSPASRALSANHSNDPHQRSPLHFNQNGR